MQGVRRLNNRQNISSAVIEDEQERAGQKWSWRRGLGDQAAREHEWWNRGWEAYKTGSWERRSWPNWGQKEDKWSDIEESDPTARGSNEPDRSELFRTVLEDL